MQTPRAHPGAPIEWIDCIFRRCSRASRPAPRPTPGCFQSANQRRWPRCNWYAAVREAMLPPAKQDIGCEQCSGRGCRCRPRCATLTSRCSARATPVRWNGSHACASRGSRPVGKAVAGVARALSQVEDEPADCNVMRPLRRWRYSATLRRLWPALWRAAVAVVHGAVRAQHFTARQCTRCCESSGHGTAAAHQPPAFGIRGCRRTRSRRSPPRWPAMARRRPPTHSQRGGRHA